MIIKKFNSIESFLNENLSFLEKEELINNKIIGNLTYYINHELKESDLLLSIIDGDKKLFAINIRNNDFIITGNEENIKYFIKYINENDIKIKKISGQKLLIDIFNSIYNKKFVIDKSTILYGLEVLNKLTLSNGYLRKANIDDKEIVIEFLNGFLYDCFNVLDTSFSEKTFDIILNENNFFVWEDKEVTSIAAIVRKTKSTSTISYVYTPEKFRKKGYGTSIVYEISRVILNNNLKFSTLFADSTNPDSNKIYQKIGYKKVEDFLDVKFIE